MYIKPILIAACLLFTAIALKAQIILVPADEPTIQDGIAEAEKGDTVLVSPGTYFENINFWGKNITVASLFLTTRDTSFISQTIIDGNYADEVVEISNEEDSTALLCGFTIRNGLSDAYGGGINCFNASPRFENLRIINNTAMYGGGISCRSRSSSDPVAHPSMVNVMISNNTSQFGGGIYLEAGIHSTAGLLRTKLQNVLITGNNATRGGGIMIAGKTETILHNLTVSGNTAAQSGGGISCQDYPVTIRNSIIWNNSPEEIYSTGSPVILFSDIRGGATGDGNINEDPKFAGSGLHPFALTAGSPCIDAGTPDTTGLNLPQKDIAGNVRLWDGDGNSVRTIDMGAYEFGSKPDGMHSLPTADCSLLTVHCYPNPSAETITIEYELDHRATVTFELMSNTGQQVAVLVDQFQPAGKHKIHWNTNGLTSGVYFYRLTANSEQATANGKVLLAR